jgi:tRNA(Ile)-lysidine synthase
LNLIHHSLEKFMKDLPVSKQAKLLLGVSGGIDSMVMLHGLHQLKYSISVAHVNFKLRDADSDEDASLVSEWCRNHQIPFFLKEIDTKKFAKQENLNTQLAARKIRYDWWDQLHQEQNFEFIATAHTLDDQIETFFIHVLRGTGMKGLRAIPPQRDYFIRPLLAVSRAEIEHYAREHQVDYRTDRSNLTDDYQRNRIRHHVIPMLQEMTPGFHSRMKHNLLRLQKEWNAWEMAFREWVDQSVHFEQDSFSITFHDDNEGFLLRWLEEKGIPWNLSYDFINSADRNTGHALQLQDYRLSRTTDGYFFDKIKKSEHHNIPQPGAYFLDDLVFTIHPVARQKIKMDNDPFEEYIAGSVVKFPLQLRPVEPGDAFQPLGMHGRTKKIQDLLVDRKLEMHEKSKVSILTNAEHILWVAGLQLDERAKVTEEDDTVYIVTYKKVNVSDEQRTQSQTK